MVCSLCELNFISNCTSLNLKQLLSVKKLALTGCRATWSRRRRGNWCGLRWDDSGSRRRRRVKGREKRRPWEGDKGEQSQEQQRHPFIPGSRLDHIASGHRHCNTRWYFLVIIFLLATNWSLFLCLNQTYNLLRKLLNANKELQLYEIGKYMCQDSFRSWEPIFLAASWSPHLFCSHNRLPLIKL
jgi:hypothetical protein